MSNSTGSSFGFSVSQAPANQALGEMLDPTHNHKKPHEDQSSFQNINRAAGAVTLDGMDNKTK